MTLSVGIGWVLGITLSMISMPLVSSSSEITFSEAMGNTLVFGFPGFVLLMVALILSLRDDAAAPYKGDF